MNRGPDTSPTGSRRLLAAWPVRFVLALMIGPQEGDQGGLRATPSAAVFESAIIRLPGIGVLVFLAITFWPR